MGLTSQQSLSALLFHLQAGDFVPTAFGRRCATEEGGQRKTKGKEGMAMLSKNCTQRPAAWLRSPRLSVLCSAPVSQGKSQKHHCTGDSSACMCLVPERVWWRQRQRQKQTKQPSPCLREFLVGVGLYGRAS